MLRMEWIRSRVAANDFKQTGLPKLKPCAVSPCKGCGCRSFDPGVVAIARFDQVAELVATPASQLAPHA